MNPPAPLSRQSARRTMSETERIARLEDDADFLEREQKRHEELVRQLLVRVNWVLGLVASIAVSLVTYLLTNFLGGP